jgi:hypothetical protein
MNRRRLLRYLAALPLIAAAPRFLRLSKRAESFYVAGTRFFPRHDDLRNGDLLLLEPRTINGENAYAICNVAGRQIGWVPRRLIPRVASAGTTTAQLITVALHRVPWRWYRAEIA